MGPCDVPLALVVGPGLSWAKLAIMVAEGNTASSVPFLWHGWTATAVLRVLLKGFSSYWEDIGALSGLHAA